MSWYERKQFIPVYNEDSIFNFYLSTEVKSTDQYCEQLTAAPKRIWQSSALASPTKTLNIDLASVEDGIEPFGAPRESVEMGNDEDEEPLEAEVPRARMNPKNPMSPEKQEHEDSGHAVS